MKFMNRSGITVRKVWRSGRSLVISFPSDWVKAGEIQEGQEFILVKQEEKLILVPAATVPKSVVPEDLLEEVEHVLSR